MKTNFSVIVSLLLCFFVLTGFASPAAPVPGYYINHHGDTIRGIFPQRVSGNIAVFKFQPANSTNVLNISFDTCQAVFCGDDLYKNWYGTRSMTYIDNFTLDIVRLDDYETGKIVLKQFYKAGTMNLFYFHDVKDRFFIEKGDSILELRTSYRYSTVQEKAAQVINPPDYFILPHYREQIIALMDGKLSRKQKLLVESCNYDQLSLIRLFRKIDKRPKGK